MKSRIELVAAILLFAGTVGGGVLWAMGCNAKTQEVVDQVRGDIDDVDQRLRDMQTAQLRHSVELESVAATVEMLAMSKTSPVVTTYASTESAGENTTNSFWGNLLTIVVGVIAVTSLCLHIDRLQNSSGYVRHVFDAGRAFKTKRIEPSMKKLFATISDFVQSRRH